jgi:hypothetical protein
MQPSRNSTTAVLHELGVYTTRGFDARRETLSSRDVVVFDRIGGEFSEGAREVRPWWSPDDLHSAIAPYLHLESNWDRYGSQPIDIDFAKEVEALLVQVLPAGMPRPEVSPTSDGGLLFEWERGSAELVMEFNPSERPTTYFEDTQSGERWEMDFLRALLTRLSGVLARMSGAD